MASAISRVRDCHPLRFPFPGDSTLLPPALLQSYNPGPAWTGPVWASARSLATTCAITFVFFSCGYWDVSVPRVRLPFREYRIAAVGCPIRISRVHAVICTSPGLFAACHVLLRLRKPQASTACPSFPVLLLSFRLRVADFGFNSASGNRITRTLFCSYTFFITRNLPVIRTRNCRSVALLCSCFFQNVKDLLFRYKLLITDYETLIQFLRNCRNP